MKKTKKKVAPAKMRTQRGTMSVPCPECGSPSRVCRTTLGERLRTSRRKRNYVVRERRCISPAKHKFNTEERTR